MKAGKKSILRHLLLISALFGFSWLLINPAYLFHGNIKGDDASYVSHTLTIALDGDLDYCNELTFYKKGCEAGIGRTAPSHPIGSGIVHAPIVRIFSVLDVIQSHPVLSDRSRYVGSWSFLGLFVSVTFSFILGLLLFISTAESINPSIPRSSVLLLVSGYGVPYYVFQRFAMSHSAEFLALAVVLWSSVRLLKATGYRKSMLLILLASSIGMSYLIRPANLNVLLIPVIVFLLAGQIEGKRHASSFSVHDGILFLAATALVLAVIATIQDRLYGVYFPDSKQMYLSGTSRIPGTFSEKVKALWFSVRYIPVVLFSSEFGLLFSAPMLFFGPVTLAFVAFLSRNNTGQNILMAFAVFLYFAVPWAVVLLWKNTGDAYGYRYLFSTAPLSFLGLILAQKHMPPGSTIFARFVFIGLSIFSIFGQVFFATSASLSPSRKINAFGRRENFSVNGYEINLVKSIASTDGWQNVLAKRYPGYLLTQVASDEQIRNLAQELELPADKFSEVFSNISSAPAYYRTGILIYGVVIPLFLWWIVFCSTGKAGMSGRRAP